MFFQSILPEILYTELNLDWAVGEIWIRLTRVEYALYVVRLVLQVSPASTFDQNRSGDKFFTQ